ncbi:MAG TPA: phage holin family protein [Candidatus Baltobacteraceae bacterium]|jgi:putative membrane protein
MYLILRLIINAAALFVVAHFVSGVAVTDLKGLFIAAIVLGIVNAIVKPILIILSLPIEILTLGLFTFVINAVLFWFVGSLHIGLIVHGWWAALWGSIILWIVSWILSAVLAPVAD